MLRDRRHLAEDGLVIVVATVDMRSGYIISGPEIISRGFIYVKESEELLLEARTLALGVIEKNLGKKMTDRNVSKAGIKR